MKSIKYSKHLKIVIESYKGSTDVYRCLAEFTNISSIKRRQCPMSAQNYKVKIKRPSRHMSTENNGL